MTPDIGVALFHTTSAAMRAERVLVRAAIGVKLVPVPRELSSDCTLALRFAWEERDRVGAVLAEAGVEFAGLHALGKEGGRKMADSQTCAADTRHTEPESQPIPDAAGAVIVAMSGGVDSAVAAALLAREGRRVVGVTLRIWSDRWPANPGRRADRCCSVGAVADARAVADRLGIPHHVMDCQDEFDREVIGPFVAAYLRGETPNPCIWCNSRLKFDRLRSRAMASGAFRMATGHYARVDRDATTGYYRLRRGADPRKDQSYFLYDLRQEQLATTLLPVGHLSKDETRRIARDLGLPVAEKPESQEICFVGGDYRTFLRTQVGDAIRPGVIRDTAGAVRGRHPGIAHFTVGQRHGLGLGNPSPLYVVALDAGRNEVVVGGEEALFSSEIDVDRVHMTVPDSLREAIPILAKLRYAQTAAPATLTPVADGRVRLIFQEAQRAVTPGQAAVFYDAKDPQLVLGGGTIVGRVPAGTPSLASTS